MYWVATDSSSGGGSTVTATIPSATQSGDLLIAVAGARDFDCVVGSSGFTAIRTAQGSGSSDIDRPLVAYRLLGSSETPPSSVDFGTGAAGYAASVLTYRPSTSIASVDISSSSWVTSGGGAVPADPFILGGSLTYESETFDFGDMNTSPSENAYGRVAFIIKEPGQHVQRGLLLHTAATNSGNNSDHLTYSPSPNIGGNPGTFADRLSIERADTIGDGAFAHRITVAVMEMKLRNAALVVGHLQLS